MWSGAGWIEIRDADGRAGVARRLAWRVLPGSFLRGHLVAEVELDQAAKPFPVTATVTQTNCTITGAIIAPVSAQFLTDFNGAYDALAVVSCDETLTGTLAGVTRAPGVYCFDAAATLTGTLTLAGPSTGI